MPRITERHIGKLIRIESRVHYDDPPPAGRLPFVMVKRPSKVLISAPHGAITFRDNGREKWHDEDDYTSGMALLLGELCGTSVIANVWQTVDSDPNYHPEPRSAYKRALRRLVERGGIRWVVDLHGAGQASPKMGREQLVDVGTRREERSLNPESLRFLKGIIDLRLGGRGLVHENGYPALETRKSMTITAFCHHLLGIEAVQIEMKPAVRVALCRIDSSSFIKGYFCRVERKMVLGMLQALADFIEHLERKSRLYPASCGAFTFNHHKN